MDLESLLIAASAELASGGLCKLVRLPARAGATVAPDPPLPEALASRVAALGVTGLWTHQAEALGAVRDGRHVVVSTVGLGADQDERFLTDLATQNGGRFVKK